MNRFNITSNNHRLGLKSKSIMKLHQTEIIEKEKDEIQLELKEIYPKELAVITHNEIDKVKIEINRPNLSKVASEPKFKKVVINAYQKFLRKEFKN